jgi:nucleoid DNA-binding protein
MNKRQLVKTIARRLPFTTVRQVEEVLEVATELWSDELQAGGQAQIPGIGRLSIEVQALRAAGAIPTKGGALRRVYGRFRPAGELLQRLEENDGC